MSDSGFWHSIDPGMSQATIYRFLNDRNEVHMKRLLFLALAALSATAISCGGSKPGSAGSYGGGTGGG
jgi:uncharacterized membrane protein